MRNALSVASECAPLVKTGGLADVVGALPGALALDNDVVLLAGIDIGGHPARAEHGLQGALDAACANGIGVLPGQ